MGKDYEEKINGGGGGGDTEVHYHHKRRHTNAVDRETEFEMQPLREKTTDNDAGAYTVGEEDEEVEIISEIGPLQEIKLHTDYFSREWWDRTLFPPHLPRSCQLLRPENIAVPGCYLLVGLLQGLSSPIIGVLPLDLAASEAQQTTFGAIRGLPASFKILFGFVSDNYPILGYRRKPYMFAGWILASLSMAALLLFSNLDVTTRGEACFADDTSEDDDATTVPNNIPDDAPSIPFLAVMVLTFGFGFWMVSTCSTIVVVLPFLLDNPKSNFVVLSS